MSEQRWIPLESNPEVLNKYIHSLGIPESCQFVDIYGLDDEILAMVPQPVDAIILLFPSTEKVEQNPIGTVEPNPSVPIYYMKQSIRNACGTVAMVHAVANNADDIQFDDTKHFVKFLKATKDLSPEERAAALESDKQMGSAHHDSAQEGQTQAPSQAEDVNPHFVTFIHKDGGLYELDGRKEGPVRHRDTTADNLLKDTADVVKEFMKRDPDQISFTLMALIRLKD
ncbi:ubiquitin carboxyl-terminal hydrolase [Patella vulgata]|uniref:ubiquitin carboxyl-terminal hydrolase n=1 Tax=Patella vulgata TaxID=6465 RepID=UPI00217F412D|nr:ubiquitin carboxyl-terminal hydrolase [Patella vulgata]